MKPYEFSMEFCAATEDMDAATALHDQLIDFAESIGLIFGGGLVSEMNRGDVVEDSPLARALGREA